jgi:hypothetical protein
VVAVAVGSGGIGVEVGTGVGGIEVGVTIGTTVGVGVAAATVRLISARFAFPAASKASAFSVSGPEETLNVRDHGAAVRVPTSVPLRRKFTFTTPTLSQTVTVIVSDPGGTRSPLCGSTIVTCGSCVSDGVAVGIAVGGGLVGVAVGGTWVGVAVGGIAVGVAVGRGGVDVGTEVGVLVGVGVGGLQF